MLYRIVARDEAGNEGERISDGPFTIDSPTGVHPVPGIERVSLLGNAPNPFNPRTTIRFELPEDTKVELDVFDISGRLVRRLVSEMRTGPARHEVVWDGIDAAGQQVASGVYFYRLRAGDIVETKQMALIK